MSWLLERTAGFFVENLPSWRMILSEGPAGLAWSFAALYFAGMLKRNGIKTGYTRKVFHFLIFGAAALVEWWLGTPSVCLFGGMCTLVIFFAVWMGPGNLLYEAIAREKDSPHRTFFIAVPYLATLAGGLAGNILFGPLATAGYLVTGLGDAVGEPAGTMFGRHHYRVPSLSSVPSTRTLEGSAAVFLMSVVALISAAALLPQVALTASAIPIILAIAAACALTEAFSPHGWDNLAMQVVPTALVWMLLT